MHQYAVILANGERPSARVLNFFLHYHSPFKVAADGGLRHFISHKYTPDLIIGDLDSVREKVLASVKDSVDVQHLQRQNDTDLEKAILYVLEAGISEVCILGADGGRMDHTIANIGLLVKYHQKAKFRIITNTSVVEAVTGNITIITQPDDVLSFYGVNGNVLVQSKGLLYELYDKFFCFGGFESTSNRAIGSSVELSIQEGVIIMVREVKDYIRNLRKYASDTSR